jgi:hypothetical protein
VRKNPSLTTTVLVSYYAGPLKTNAVRIAPVVNSFTLNKYAGKNTELFLTSALLLTEVRIFFWSILREGSKTPLFSGNSLQTVNGVSTVGNVNYAKSFYYRARLLTKEGQDIPYISCSVRSNRRWSRLDEKILNTGIQSI